MSERKGATAGRGMTALRRSLLRWYDTNRRDLPWRRTTDPYAIWLSEIMLQQTTVRTVLPRWERFLKRWPTVRDLAGAKQSDVLHEWTGLGYYARARNLHKAAQTIVRDFEGRMPARYELLLALPGMGPYTAAAVASIAFGESVPVVDANVERVLARLDGLRIDVKSSAGKRHLKERARALLSPSRPGDFNQAMMELGATVCLPRRPACEACPWRRSCRAWEEQAPEEYPVKAGKPPMEDMRESAVIVRRGRRVLVLLRPDNVSFGGMWELPRVECREDEDARSAARRAVRELTGLTVEPRGPTLRLRHVVMRRRIVLHVYTADGSAGRVTRSMHRAHRWVTPKEWMELPRSTTQAQVSTFLVTGQPPNGGRRGNDRFGDGDDLFGPLDEST